MHKNPTQTITNDSTSTSSTLHSNHYIGDGLPSSILKVIHFWSDLPHLQQYKLQKKHNYEACPLTSLLKQMWHSIRLNLWHPRNDARHGKDTKTKQQTTRHQLHKELQQLHALKEKTDPLDHHIFYESVAEHMESDAVAIRNWISCYKPLILKSIHRSEAAARQGSKLLTAYFKRTHFTRKRRKRKRSGTPQLKSYKYTTIFDHVKPCIDSPLEDSVDLSNKQNPYIKPDHPT